MDPTCPHCRTGMRAWVRFGPNLVHTCDACHALDARPLVDPRVPSFREHLKLLQEEIQVEEQEAAEDKALGVVVEETGPSPTGLARLRVQVMDGDPRWVVKESRVEGRVAGDKPKPENLVNLEVLRKAGAVLDLEADKKAWQDLARGTQLTVHAPSNATLYRNLLKAFLAVSKRAERFEDLQHPERLPRIPRHGAEDADVDGLRPGQAQAVKAALRLPDAGLLMIHGPPGTGKTTVIARFLKEAVKRGKTVLVTSHTHVAIDNALRKAMRDTPALGDRIVRLGEVKNVGADLHDKTRPIGSFAPDPEDPDAKPLFENIWREFPIVGMTLDALANAWTFAEQTDQDVRPFDYVVVDEAGMNGYPKLAMAHAAGKRLLLVGDPLQLPPIVRAWSFRNDENHKRSHFEVLQMTRRDLSVLLDEQFRCHPQIYDWSDKAVYGGQVASMRERPPLVPILFDEPLRSPVVWIDTAKVPGARDERVGTSRINPTHAAIALHVLRDLVRQGVDPADIGYISPFKAQAVLFDEALTETRTRAAGLVTASTVDAFQGNERRAILFDLTSRRPARPHQDHRRLNVSLTRAEDLLVLIGPRSFVLDPKHNPYYWSLQQWGAVQPLRWRRDWEDARLMETVKRVGKGKKGPVGLSGKPGSA